MSKIVCLFLVVMSFESRAQEYANTLGDAFIDPHVAAGVNTVQGTTVLIGVDVGYRFTDQISAGVGGFGQFGEKPSRDRTLGGGPFAQFLLPVTPFLTFSAREDVDYVDVRTPRADTYFTTTGLASFTTVGVHLKLARAFGISGGYRAALGLTNSDLGEGRSMPYLGFSIGI